MLAREINFLKNYCLTIDDVTQDNYFNGHGSRILKSLA